MRVRQLPDTLCKLPCCENISPGTAENGRRRKVNHHMQWGPVMLISLTKEKIAIIDIEDWPVVSQHNWSTHHRYAIAGYAAHGKLCKVFMHRLILSPHSSPKTTQVDHIDGNGLLNTRQNLRLATASQNKCNQKRRCDNRSGIKGVYQSKPGGSWRAIIGINGKQENLGSFSTKEEAGMAYRKAAERLHGEFKKIA